jgi:hypothetical protein
MATAAIQRNRIGASCVGRGDDGSRVVTQSRCRPRFAAGWRYVSPQAAVTYGLTRPQSAGDGVIARKRAGVSGARGGKRAEKNPRRGSGAGFGGVGDIGTAPGSGGAPCRLAEFCEPSPDRARAVGDGASVLPESGGCRLPAGLGPPHRVRPGVPAPGPQPPLFQPRSHRGAGRRCVRSESNGRANCVGRRADWVASRWISRSCVRKAVALPACRTVPYPARVTKVFPGLQPALNP